MKIQSNDSDGSMNSYAITKFEKTSDKSQSRLLTIFDEQTIAHELLCLWLLEDSFQNRLLLSLRISQSNKISRIIEMNFREIAPCNLKH